jgi:hypothetical protein
MLWQSFASVPPSEILPASKFIPRKEIGMDEQESTWWTLCRQAWAEEDPVKLLDVTMKINSILTRKQERLDRMYDQAPGEAVNRQRYPRRYRARTPSQN